VIFLKSHFSLHSGHSSGKVAAVKVKAQLPHFQWVKLLSSASIPSTPLPRTINSGLCLSAVMIHIPFLEEFLKSRLASIKVNQAI
jgi:hypothetical protein